MNSNGHCCDKNVVVGYFCSDKESKTFLLCGNVNK